MNVKSREKISERKSAGKGRKDMIAKGLNMHSAEPSIQSAQ